MISINIRKFTYLVWICDAYVILWYIGKILKPTELKERKKRGNIEKTHSMTKSKETRKRERERERERDR